MLVHQVWAGLQHDNSSNIDCAGSVPFLQRLDATHSCRTARLSQILLLPRNLATSGRSGAAPSSLGGGARRSGPSLRVQVMRGLVNLMDQLAAAEKHRSQGPVLLEVSGVVLQHIASVARCAHFVKHHQLRHAMCSTPNVTCHFESPQPLFSATTRIICAGTTCCSSQSGWTRWKVVAGLFPLLLKAQPRQQSPAQQLPPHHQASGHSCA